MNGNFLEKNRLTYYAYQKWDWQLPIIKTKMHHRFCIPTHHTASPIGGQPVKDTLVGRASHCVIFCSRGLLQLQDTCHTSVLQPFLLHCQHFVLNALRYELEELLCVLVFARGEQWAAIGTRYRRGKDANYIVRT